MSRALFDCSESETNLLNPIVLLQTSTTVNANPTVRTDSNLKLVWPKPIPASCVIKQSLSSHDVRVGTCAGELYAGCHTAVL